MKQIKFNLTYAGNSVKSLAEFRENPNIDILLETIKNGLMERWLRAQGEEELANKIRAKRQKP